ncbi:MULTISPECIES: D-glucuronyl C5-epimerase family protein [Pseudomonas]|uniref:D-glucuronyl C5-epimerase family protein n=1 Tax=Pseudomonas sp. Cab53 TaxID=2678258 RepID=UPI001BB3D3E4|nr:D-glucuronyl C5-epimerase family protein [Pseudomonas sp. Cab53]
MGALMILRGIFIRLYVTMLINSKKLLFLFFCLAMSCASVQAQQSDLLKFYAEGSPNYPWAFGTSKECDATVGMSSRTKNFRSPSKLAIRGLEAALSGDLAGAVACEKKLRVFEKMRGGGLFYAFMDDYIDAWPFQLRAPWVSAFTQGIALEFYMEMAKKTGNIYYKNKAEAIYLSYSMPVDKGGFARTVGKDVLFEEYPVNERIAVLNGNLIATIALYDYAQFSKSKAPLRLATRSVAWLEKNIQSYVIQRPEYPGPISAYSLAPSRLDVLFRFYLTHETLDVFSIKLAAKDVSRSILPGTPGDHDITRDASLIVSADMNWSEPYKESKQPRTDFRKIVEAAGAFNHAPFRVEVKTIEELSSLKQGASLEVSYRAQGSSDVQISDGKTFYKIGTLGPTRGEVVTVVFELPAAAIANLTFPVDLKYNVLYLEHNQKLLEIVAGLSESDVLKKYATLLKR